MRTMVRDGRWVTDDDDFDRRGNAVWIVGGVLAAMARGDGEASRAVQRQRVSESGERS